VTETAPTRRSLSVVICTYNRAHLLRRALDSLRQQTLPFSAFEVIVVDNNSSDDTAAVSAECAGELPNLLYARETRQGLSHARNCGWRAAVGDYVGYMDDDCRAPRGWLEAASRVATSVRPDAFGGPIHGYFESRPPKWVKPEYVCHDPLDGPQFLDEKNFGLLHGGNLFVRRDLTGRVGEFDSELGMTGDTVGYGEETALLRRIAEDLGGTIYYDPDLRLDHLIRPDKMTLRYSVRASFAAGRSRYRMNSEAVAAQSGPRGTLAITAEGMRTARRLAADLARGVLRRSRVRYPYLRNYLHERSLRRVRRLGGLYEELRSGRGRSRT